MRELQKSWQTSTSLPSISTSLHQHILAEHQHIIAEHQHILADFGMTGHSRASGCTWPTAHILLLATLTSMCTEVAASAGKDQPPELYTALGLQACDASASAKDIKAGHRKLSLQHHPDKNGGEPATRFIEIQHAYGILRHDSKRAAYDATCKLSYRPATSQFSPSSFFSHRVLETLVARVLLSVFNDAGMRWVQLTLGAVIQAATVCRSAWVVRQQHGSWKTSDQKRGRRQHNYRSRSRRR